MIGSTRKGNTIHIWDRRGKILTQLCDPNKREFIGDVWLNPSKGTSCTFCIAVAASIAADAAALTEKDKEGRCGTM